MVDEEHLIFKGGIRIMRPHEMTALLHAIPKFIHRNRLQALLYTGCRYTELQWLFNHRNALKGNSILMPSTKPEARHKERYIRLTQNGVRAVKDFLNSKKNLPTHQTWDENLKRWCTQAGIDPKGVSSKFTRRTWEAWLFTQYGEKHKLDIFLSMGHTEKVAMEFYLMLPFSDEDKSAMHLYTDGWL